MPRRELSPLMAEFLVDLGGRDAVRRWAGAAVSDPHCDAIAKANALLLLSRAGGGRLAAPAQLAGRQLRAGT